MPVRYTNSGGLLLGPPRDYYIDTIPKLLISAGDLSQILALTNVTRYLEFRQISGSFVYRDGHIYKVPATEMEAVMSPLFGLFEKRRAHKFFDFIRNYDEASKSQSK